MTYRELTHLFTLGLPLHFFTAPVSGRGYALFVYSTDFDSAVEVRTNRGQRRFFKSLDTVHRFASSFYADLTVYDSIASTC